MEKIKAYECSYCGKILKSYSGMWKHEKKCFLNPDTKSCIICANIDWAKPTINNKAVSDFEENVFNYKIEGTYYEAYDPDYGSMKLLEKEYEYLNQAEPCHYCESYKCVLSKLRTNCDKFKQIG